MQLVLDGVKRNCKAGDIIVVERGKPHSFSSVNGAVFEEISSTHFVNDSFYDDPNIAPAADRKTYMTFYNDWLTEGVIL